jgi:hypothetical protein
MPGEDSANLLFLHSSGMSVKKIRPTGGFCSNVVGGTHEDNNRRGSNKRAGCNF